MRRLYRFILSSPLALLAVACGSPGFETDPTNVSEGTAIDTTASPLAGQPTRAMILIDSRLSSALGSIVTDYRDAAERRRGFSIALNVVNGLDDMTYAAVKSYVIQQRTSNPSLEGVLFMGNVKLPSFYKNRADLNYTRIYPVYFEDLDGQFTKTYADGAIDPVCNGSNDDHCAVYGPFTVPPHDLDQYKKGPNPDPEIWAAFMPVGFDTGNTYTAYANQLRPYLQKLVSFYRLGLPSNGKHYFVSNDIGDDYATTWATFGPTNLDFYGKPGPNGETGAACISGSTNLCYKRWPTETYASSTAFIDAYRASPWVDEGWQTPSIFMGHMNSNRYDAAEVNVHSEDDNSLVTATEAKTITKGALLVLLSGCGVASFAQPGSPSGTDHPWTSVADNVSAGWLYGSSSALAVLGEPHLRAHYANYPTVMKEIRTNRSYLGAGHLAQQKKQFAIAGTDYLLLKEQVNEALLGDPFMDLEWYENFETGSGRWTTVLGSWSIVTSGSSKVYKSGSSTGTMRTVAGETTWTNQKIEARIKPTAWNGTGSNAALVGRYKDESNMYQLQLLNSNTIELKKKVAGTWTSLKTVAFTVATNTTYTVRFELTGSTLNAYVNGLLKTTATDTSLASGRAGLSTNTAVAEFDNVRITP